MTAVSYSNGDDILPEEPVDFQTAQSTYNDYAYERRCYVEVLTNNESCSFWIGLVDSAHENADGDVTTLTVNWLQAKDGIYDSL